MKLPPFASMLTLAAAAVLAAPGASLTYPECAPSPLAQQEPAPQGQPPAQGQGQPSPKQQQPVAGDSGQLPEGQQPNPVSAADEEKAFRPPTPEERIAALKQQIAKLENERAYLQSIQQAGGIVARIRQHLDTRRVTAESFTDKSAPVGPMPVAGVQPPRPAKKARLLGDAEKAKLAEDVIFTVDGTPVTRPEFDELLAYLKSYPRDESEDQLKQLAILQMVKVKVGESSFADGARAAHNRIEAVQKKLAEGADFAALAKETSDCPSKDAGGDLGYFGRDAMDLSFTRAAFSLKPGEVSGIVASTYGYHLIKVTGVKKGERPELDQVQASHILAMYDHDLTKVQEAQNRVATGDVDVAFRSDDLRKHAPDILK